MKLEKTRNDRVKGDKIKRNKRYTKSEIIELRKAIFSPTTYWSREKEASTTFENSKEQYIVEVTDHFLIRSFERNVMTDSAFVLLQNLCEQGDILEVPVGEFFAVVSKKDNVAFCFKFDKMMADGNIVISALTTYKELSDFEYYPDEVIFEAESSDSREISFNVWVNKNAQDDEKIQAS